jgi:hypothetical protein
MIKKKFTEILVVEISPSKNLITEIISHPNSNVKTYLTRSTRVFKNDKTELKFSVDSSDAFCNTILVGYYELIDSKKIWGFDVSNEGYLTEEEQKEFLNKNY